VHVGGELIQDLRDLLGLGLAVGVARDVMSIPVGPVTDDVKNEAGFGSRSDHLHVVHLIELGRRRRHSFELPFHHLERGFVRGLEGLDRGAPELLPETRVVRHVGMQVAETAFQRGDRVA
jgi:hypothetical protein